MQIRSVLKHIDQLLELTLPLPVILDSVTFFANDCFKSYRCIVIQIAETSNRISRVQGVRFSENTIENLNEISKRVTEHVRQNAGEPVIVNNVRQHQFFSESTSLQLQKIEHIVLLPIFREDPEPMLWGFLYLDRKEGMEPFPEDPQDFRLLTSAFGKILRNVDIYRQYRLTERRPREAVYHHIGEQIFCGCSPQLLDMVDAARSAARFRTPLALIGEQGTEPLRLAHAIHQQQAAESGSKPLIIVDGENMNQCPAPDSGLREPLPLKTYSRISEPFQEAVGGTLVILNVDRLSQTSQIELNNLMASSFYGVLPGDENRDLVRVISISQEELDVLTTQQTFLLELSYRLSSLPISLPPLRERLSDLEPMMRWFFQQSNPDRQIVARDEVLSTLVQHEWPMNELEFRNCLQHIARKLRPHEREITLEHLPPELRERRSVYGNRKGSGISREKVVQALVEAQNVRKIAHKILGVSRTTLYKKIDEFQISKEEIASLIEQGRKY